MAIIFENNRRYVKQNDTVADLKSISDEDVARVYTFFHLERADGGPAAFR